MKKKIKVLRVITRLPVGGIERRLVTIAPRLNDDEFETSVCCIKERGVLADELEKKGVKFFLIPTKTRLNIKSIFSLAQLMKQERIDIVHSHMYRSNVPATIAAKIAGVPVIISQIHNVDTWETRRQRLLDMFLCKWRDKVIAVSGNVKNDILKNLKISPDKCDVIYNGIDIGTFNKNFDKSKIKESLGIKEENKVVSIIARLVEQKNHKGFLQTAKILAEKDKNVIFLVVGDGKLKEELEKQANELGISKQVVFTGRRDDIPEILSITDVSVLLSFKEGFSNTIVESLAAGVPVVASNVGGNAEAVIDGKTGFIIEPNVPELAAEKISLLIQNTQLYDTISNNCKKYIQKFSIDAMVEDTKNLYRSLYKVKNK